MSGFLAIRKDDSEPFARFDFAGAATDLAIRPAHQCKTAFQHGLIGNAIQNARERFQLAALFCQKSGLATLRTPSKVRELLALISNAAGNRARPEQCLRLDQPCAMDLQIAIQSLAQALACPIESLVRDRE